MFVEVFDEVLQTIVSVSKHFSTHHEWYLIMRNKTTQFLFFDFDSYWAFEKHLKSIYRLVLFCSVLLFFRTWLWLSNKTNHWSQFKIILWKAVLCCSSEPFEKQGLALLVVLFPKRNVAQLQWQRTVLQWLLPAEQSTDWLGKKDSGPWKI